MIHLDERKLKDKRLRKPVPYLASRGDELLEFRFPANAAYHLNERSVTDSPNDRRSNR